MAYQIVQYPKRIETAENFKPVIGSLWLDRNGDRWSAVEFTPGTYEKGMVVRDWEWSDISSNDTAGSITTEAAVDTDLLIASGETFGDIRGAIGSIVGGGQNFQVLKTLDANTLQIALLGADKKSGWKTALTTSDNFRIRLPGRVALSLNTEGTFNRGIVDANTFTVPAGEFRYGYVRQTGLGEGLLDNSGESIKGDRIVVASNDVNGKIEGVPSSLNADNITDKIGEALFSDPGGSADHLILVHFTISNDVRSFRTGRAAIAPTRSVE